MWRLILILILLFSFAIPAQAQAVRPACAMQDLDNFASALELAIAGIRQARLLMDLPGAIRAVEGVHAASEGMLSACNPLRFDSEDHGQQAVITAISIGPGVYLATVMTDGAMRIQIEANEGVCAAQEEGPLFDFEAGAAQDGIDAIFISEGCTVTISTSDPGSGWLLELTRIR